MFCLVGFSQQTLYRVTAGHGNGLRFWDSESYKIHMGNYSEYHYGPVTDYSIKMNMNATAGRGWTWGIAGQTPIAALNNVGHMQIAGDFTMYDGLYFRRSGTASDGLPQARFVEDYGIRFQSLDSRWVFSSKQSVLIGYDPDGTSWGDDNLYVAGNVGIGTSNPTYPLELNKTQDGRTRFSIINASSGANQETSMMLLSNTTGFDMITYGSGVGGTTASFPRSKSVIFRSHGSAPADRLLFGTGSSAPIHFFTAEQPRMTISSSGEVGIGTTTPDAKLTVKGNIHAEEVTVDLSVPGPDYVFEEDYDLPTLTETEDYIKANKHLPEIPSAKEMEEEGIDLGEMNMLLLKKIEELTLHQISQQKEIEILRQDKASRQGGLESLLIRIELLENQIEK